MVCRGWPWPGRLRRVNGGEMQEAGMWVTGEGQRNSGGHRQFWSGMSPCSMCERLSLYWEVVGTVSGAWLEAFGAPGLSLGGTVWMLTPSHSFGLCFTEKWAKFYSAECSYQHSPPQIQASKLWADQAMHCDLQNHEWKWSFPLPYIEPVRRLEQSQRANTEMKIESQPIKRLALPSLGTSYLVLSLYWLIYSESLSLSRFIHGDRDKCLSHSQRTCNRETA